MDSKNYLVNKITTAMKMKYDDAFNQINYSETQLRRDIQNLITTQYYSWHPKDVFLPVEKDLLSILKKRNPDIEIKVKKARYIERPTPVLDKYQEADLDEEMKQKKFLEELQMRRERIKRELEEKKRKKRLKLLKKSNTRKNINLINNNNNNNDYNENNEFNDYNNINDNNENNEENEENEENYAFLPPEHPHLKRYQISLEEQ
jgi:hypothetical protein